MEIDVVHEKHARLLQRREQAGDFFRQRRDLIGGRAIGREPGGADFEDAARFVHLVAGEAVQRRKKAQGVGIERRRSLRNVGSRAVARPHDAHGRQRAQASANRGAADANLRCEVAFGRKAIAGLERAALDEVANMGNDLPSPALDARAGRLPTGVSVPGRGSAANGACGHDKSTDLTALPPGNRVMPARV